MLTDKTCLSVQFLQIGPVKKNVQIRAIFFRQKFNSSPKTLIYNITSKASYIFELEWKMKKSWLTLVSYVGKLHFWGFFSERTKKNRENGEGIRYRRKENSVILWRIAKHVWNHSNMVMYVCRVIPIYPESNNWFKYCKYSNSSSFITYWNQEEGIRNLVERLRCWIKILPLKKSWFWGDEVFIACIVYVPNLALRVYHTF